MKAKSLFIILSLVAVLLAAGCTSLTSSEKNKDVGISSGSGLQTTSSSASGSGLQTTSSSASGSGLQTGSNSASGSTSPSSSSQFEVTVNSVDKYQPDNQYTKPHTGYEFIIVDFSVKNIGYKSGYNFDPYNVKVTDPDGYSYDYSSASYSATNKFSTQKIAYGDTARGKLVFEVVPKPSGTAYTVKVD